MKLKTFLVMLAFGLWSLAFGQKTEAPTTYKLNAEASKAYSQLSQRQEELRREFAQLETNKLALLIGAGVPADARECAMEADVVVCRKPAPAASPTLNTRTPTP